MAGTLTKLQREVYQIIRMKSNKEWFNPNELLPFHVHQQIATCDRLAKHGMLDRRLNDGIWEYRIKSALPD